jgi:hypothetical protein
VDTILGEGNALLTYLPSCEKPQKVDNSSNIICVGVFFLFLRCRFFFVLSVFVFTVDLLCLDITSFDHNRTNTGEQRPYVTRSKRQIVHPVGG